MSVCFFLPPPLPPSGIRTEQDFYVRLIDSMTKQVSLACLPSWFAFPLPMKWGAGGDAPSHLVGLGLEGAAGGCGAPALEGGSAPTQAARGQAV